MKTTLSEIDLDSTLETITGFEKGDYEEYKLALDEYLEFQEKNPQLTLDKVVYEVDKPKEKHQKPTGHLLLSIVGKILADIEIENKIENNWVLDFQQVLIKYIIENYKTCNDENMLNNLTIISLNYDRVFEHFISKDFHSKLLKDENYCPTDSRKSTALSMETQLSIIKPHGYLATLKNQNDISRVGMNPDLVTIDISCQGVRYPGNDQPLSYGDSKLNTKNYFLRMGKHMYVVDERNQKDYEKANRKLKEAKTVFCVGLSIDGICQSHLTLKKNQNVILTNEKQDLNRIKECKPGPSYSSIGKKDSYLRASKFTGIFKNYLFPV